MAKRQLNRRQNWRIQKIQDERAKRAAKRGVKAQEEIADGDLGEERNGLIIAHFGTQVEVEAIDCDDAGLRQKCHLRANLGSLVTGDKVIWRQGRELGVIVAVLDRKSELSRPDAYGNMKVVAANIDQVVIVIAPYPEPHANLVDRYLVATETLNITPIILVNKIDRIDDSNRAFINALISQYRSLNYTVLEVSSQQTESLVQLQEHLTDKISVFVGQSGVGKSSLINALLPDANTRVGALSEATQKGTHTTTTAKLFHFPAGGDLIDSPGIREFALAHIEADQVLSGFIEIRPLLGYCKFRDCKHQHEPGCAIKNALAEGKISPLRYASCQHILQSLQD